MKHAPDFKTHQEHDKWVIENADYFTVIVPKYRNRIRIEVETLEQARQSTKGIIADDDYTHCIIYAVCGVYSAYVETVSK